MNLFNDEILVGRAYPEPTGGDGWRPTQNPIITSWLLSSAVSDTGQNITPETAMAASAVFACVSVISSALSTLPINVSRISDGKKLDKHPVAVLLNSRLNAEMTSASGREALIVNALLYGNSFAYIELDGLRPAALWPMRSSNTSPYRQPQGALYFNTIMGGQQYQFSPDQVWHLPDLSYDGIVGLSRVRQASNPIGLMLAMEKYGAKYFANGANAGGFLELPAGMKPDQVKNFIASWKREYTGLDNSLKTGVLTDGMKYTRTAIDPRNSQMIDTRLFQVREIARIFRVPLHKIGDMGQATFSNIEQQNMEFVQDCLCHWAVKSEQEMESKLLLESEKGELCIRHDFDSLQRGDTQARYTSYNLGLQGGWLTRNEVREWEGLSPLDGGDVPLQPLNMGPANGKQENPPTPTTAPKPANPDKKEEEEEDDEDGD